MLLRGAVKYWQGMAYFYAGKAILSNGLPEEWSLVTCCHCRCPLHYCHAASCTHGFACWNCACEEQMAAHLQAQQWVVHSKGTTRTLQLVPEAAPDVQWDSEASAPVARPLIAQDSCGEPSVSKQKAKRYRKPKTNNRKTESDEQTLKQREDGAKHILISLGVDNDTFDMSTALTMHQQDYSKLIMVT